MNAPLPPGFAQAEIEAADETGMELLLWILVWSELGVFAVLLTAFTILNLRDPAGFAQARAHLDIPLAALATAVLLTSGYFAACAAAAQRPRSHLVAAATGGLAFCALKAAAYWREAHIPTLQDSGMFELYLLITGFHLAHVFFVAGLLLLVSWRPERRSVGLLTTVWHLIDLVWIVILPVVYLG